MLMKATRLPPRTPRPRGFTLIEMMVTITLLAILLALAFPAMNGWVRNSRVRTVTDTLQNGLRLAQAEALRRSRQTVFSLTADTHPEDGLTATTNGANWSVNFVPLLTGEEDDPTFIEGGVLTGVAPDAQIAGPATVCFSSLGRLVANPTPGTGVACAATAATYDVTVPGADRPLRVLVALGGQVRLCDPAKTLSNTHPDGCPA
ncbi:pilus assembly FimT family protein [Variovorax sp. ZT4R33]|uniref:pilus assembly FimT family protein n=1 Tax=Variovorax sp. ZT4R33 TaxID=3443743 RepID=UPI003F46600B